MESGQEFLSGWIYHACSWNKEEKNIVGDLSWLHYRQIYIIYVWYTLFVYFKMKSLAVRVQAYKPAEVRNRYIVNGGQFE